MGVRLIEPVTGCVVIANDETAAARLISKGFRRADAQKKPVRKTATKKRTTKKEL